jgi:aspartyl-tRNA(Asn)/glutamyl-tRNA(Gln) amidotransferase subunit C
VATASRIDLTNAAGSGLRQRGIETLTAGPGDLSDMSESVVDPEDVRHVAALARVDLDDDEVDRFAAQFAEVLESFEALESVPDVESEPDLANVMRPDEERASLDREEALRNAPESEAGFFKGPKVS